MKASIDSCCQQVHLIWVQQKIPALMKDKQYDDKLGNNPLQVLQFWPDLGMPL